jgi:hypothetical protein
MRMAAMNAIALNGSLPASPDVMTPLAPASIVANNR